MKKNKIIARMGLWVMFASGVAAIVSELVLSEQFTNLSPYIIWGYGIMAIVISLLFLNQNYQKPKPHKLKKK